MDGKHLLILVRICAILWFAFAALSLFAVFSPQNPLAFIGRGATVGEGFLAGVQTLWIIAAAAFDALIGWLVWRMDSKYRQSLTVLLAIILAFSVLSGNLARGVIAAATLILITRRRVEWLFIPGGRPVWGRRSSSRIRGDNSWIEF